MEWRQSPDFPKYEVSETGAIRNFKTKVEKVGRPNGDYMIINLMDGQKYTTAYVHRVVCGAWHGSAPSPKHEAAHGDGISTHNRPDNLAWKTPKANRADKAQHGTIARGERSGKAKLTEVDVLAIRADPRTCREIAPGYDVTPQAIRAVKNRKCWGWLK